jgi:hypothetical protein
MSAHGFASKPRNSSKQPHVLTTDNPASTFPLQSSSASAEKILQLQRLIGNRATRQLSVHLQRTISTPTIQRVLIPVKDSQKEILQCDKTEIRDYLTKVGFGIIKIDPSSLDQIKTEIRQWTTNNLADARGMKEPLLRFDSSLADLFTTASTTKDLVLSLDDVKEAIELGNIKNTTYSVKVVSDGGVQISHGETLIGHMSGGLNKDGTIVSVTTANITSYAQGTGLGVFTLAAFLVNYEGRAEFIQLGTPDTRGGFWTPYGISVGIKPIAEVMPMLKSIPIASKFTMVEGKYDEDKYKKKSIWS